jgi:nicotinamidase-related amidase
VEEAVFFHTIARNSQPLFDVKGQNPLTEHYSAVRAEVLFGPDGKRLAARDGNLIQKLLDFDAVIIAGQAKSHCVAWTIEDVLNDLRAVDERLVGKVYLLDDCASPVVIPGSVDYTAQAEAAYQKFAEAGAHIVRSTEPMASWLSF